MVPRMRARGVDVTVAVLQELHEGPFEQELRQRGVPFLPTAAGGIYSPAHVLSIRAHLQKFDIVQVCLFPAQFFVPVAALLARNKIPLVLSEQTTYHRRRRTWLHPLECWMYSRYAAIACASEAIAASLTEWIPATAPKMTVIPNGIDWETFHLAKPLPGSSLGLRNSSCVGPYLA